MFITVKIRSLAKPAIAVFAAVLFVAAVFLAFPGKSVGVLAPYNCRTLLIDAGTAAALTAARYRPKALKKAMLTLRLRSECPGYAILSA